VAFYETDEKRWGAVQARDVLADLEFFYGVITTGVYCYPSCPSRHALRINTRFFDSRQEALCKGFRSCKRCLSDQVPLAERQQRLVELACRKIETSTEAVAIELLAENLQISRFYLHKLFKRFLGVSPKQYAKAVRGRQMEAALSDSLSVTDALYDAGYNSASAYYSSGAERLGLRASRVRKGGQGMHIRYAFGKTRFGKILVASTDRGICSVLFGETEPALIADVESRFPNAEIARDEETLASTVSEVVLQVEHPSTESTLPMDIQGTAFQEKVWSALQNIKPGTTATYSQIAKQIDKPKAARAVATACAANPVAGLVPCHRVVRASGELSGYRWGVERKRQLIDNESATGSDND